MGGFKRGLLLLGIVSSIAMPARAQTVDNWCASMAPLVTECSFVTWVGPSGDMTLRLDVGPGFAGSARVEVHGPEGRFGMFQCWYFEPFAASCMLGVDEDFEPGDLITVTVMARPTDVFGAPYGPVGFWRGGVETW